ncbi:hypothetical protein VE01_09371 [Pseudogymnoascus verrucosus]|uniref:ER transporter 6TM N-terminal domain-containing protein n=1 Tax=Pseudogymnoascus verrucosus TaxID=342668 RepID=A0A1B8G961_9PEZI|nr:uncharacterized protein VE01_09371 [Pseudogymnoascus verrucosus]OBT92362.1 hypothetical protein VE01_09371 [Pseudogymnoascus verrucosus]
MKGALPPTIVIAISQSDAISGITLTIGYLAALIAVTSQCLMPRAKFMKIMFFNLIAACVAASLCCLVSYCAVKGRQNSTPADALESVKSGYNSDACAISAVFLIVIIWGANSLRAWRPMEMQDPMVVFSIFSVVTITRTGTFLTVSQGLEFIARLLKGFLIGFAVSTGVSLLILPITSRDHVFQDLRESVAQVEVILQLLISFVGESSTTELCTDHGLLSRPRTARSTREIGNENDSTSSSGMEIEQKQLKESMDKLNALHSKLREDLFYANDEIAWGKLSAGDISTIADMFQNIMLPLSGMAILPETLEMIVQNKPLCEICTMARGSDNETTKQMETRKVVDTLRKSLMHSTNIITTGLQFFLLVFEFIKPERLDKQRRSQNMGSEGRDEESNGEYLDPLQPDFAARFERAVHEFHFRRKHILEALSSLEAFSGADKLPDELESSRNRSSFITSGPDIRQEFFLVLYVGHLQDSLLNATIELITFASSNVSHGTKKRNRLIFPKQNIIRGWFFLASERRQSDSVRRQSYHVDPSSVRQGQEMEHFPDPEHLPPANAWEKGSNVLRWISHKGRSEFSMFGFRVAAASFSVAILAFLHQTQTFFIRQRCIWAMIVIVIGMSPTSGQSMFGFIARIAATVISVVLSIFVWYIVDGKTIGVIIFLYLANIFEYYFYVKKPQFFGPSVIAIVTLNVIIGYELQVRKLGLEVATSNGQPYYPIYLFAPYKLAAVAAGCAISFFWAIFPYPITAKSKVRKLLGRSLFVLAKFYSAMHTTIELWMSDELGDIQNRHSPSFKLQAARHELFQEEMLLLNSLRVHSHFTTFEPAIGGKFPKQVYDSIILEIQRILTNMSLMAHTTQNLKALPFESEGGNSMSEDDKWISQLARIALESADFKSHSTTSLLCHLSGSIMSGEPLPPYLSTLHSFPLARQLQETDSDLLNIRHVEDPAFSAFVSLEVLRSQIGFSLKNILDHVKSLVGELTFDFHVMQTPEYLESTQLTTSNGNLDEDGQE